MIHYRLRCDRAHGFEGWFKDSSSFDRQAESGLVACPVCGSVTVERALMTPALGRARGRKEASAGVEEQAERPSRAWDIVPALDPSAAPPQAFAAEDTADKLRALLRHLRREVESRCDYVGPNFAEEARRIHYGETEARNIFGEATTAQAEALTEEGIAFGIIPWARTDS